MEQALAKLGAERLDRILAAAIADPDTMCRVADAIPPPTEPVQDYITEIDTRRDLFDEFRALCQHYRLPPPNATVLALFIVAPVSEISIYLQSIRNSRYTGIMINGTSMIAPQGIRASRDGHICVFSGMPDPAAAHIFPFATSMKKNFGHLNGMLTAFWGSEKSLVWGETFQNADITQSAKNGISMSNHVHFWFDNARFALKPLRETPEGIVKAILKPAVWIFPDQDILLQAGLTDQNWGDSLAHRRSGVTIRTGQTFLLRADNPEDKPSWELLEMQWNLLRVAAICGAADVTDDYYDYREPEERGYDETIAARQSAILAEWGESVTGRDARDKGKEGG
ncbi:hypothetical protein QBC46DRAFT_440494 [Diplogelasinospora grovesii]|uniref:HNH nuclease domain-containing protein n=1 Tax=Diplogelasinospora grovesii TaxID=303347 RepID=A0AAN6N4W5_9PEZI|nr:hypothetical protein QBC46DRAFT_440494 [Diplogelasinospora grovesii]